MIKAAVFSDTHGVTSLMISAIRRCRPDVIIHLGDHDRDTYAITENFPETPLYSVRGNCDFYATSPDTDIVPLGGAKAFITHGHLYDVNWGTDKLAYAAMEQGCTIAMYGHTHAADNSQLGGVYIINPGTAGKGRPLTWAYLEVYDDGAVKAEIRPLL